MPLLAELDRWELAAERRRTLGYFPGPYCSALHLAWRMQNVPELRAAAAANRLRFGLSAAWLLAALGRPAGHQMDYSLVQAMGLYDFRRQRYWPEWLERLGVPQAALPQAVPNVHEFGDLRLGDVDVRCLHDRRPTVGPVRLRLPDARRRRMHPRHRLLRQCVRRRAYAHQEMINVYFAWVLGDLPSYCLEADTTVTGAAIRWMREAARLFDRDDELGPLAASVPDSGGVVFVPAFTGLNVPYNDHSARGAILGLTLGSTRGHIVRAFLEALGYQVRADPRDHPG